MSVVTIIDHAELFCGCIGSVEISSAEFSHAGHYVCSAKNAAGSTQRHIQLTVQGKNISETAYEAENIKTGAKKRSMSEEKVVNVKLNS